MPLCITTLFFITLTEGPAAAGMMGDDFLTVLILLVARRNEEGEGWSPRVIMAPEEEGVAIRLLERPPVPAAVASIGSCCFSLASVAICVRPSSVPYKIPA
jgi:hypothetical protein